MNELTKIVDRFWNDRVGFVEGVIQPERKLTSQQKKALKAIDKKDSLSIASGHGTGKSTIMSWCILHYMVCRPFPKIPCTAPSKPQLKSVLWPEIKKWHRRMQTNGNALSAMIANNYIWTAEKFFHKDNPGEWFAEARTASKENPEALQGFHGDYVMIICDEASGIPQRIFETAEGSTGLKETKFIMVANPTRLEGTFFDSHHRLKGHYHTMTFSCLDSLQSKGGLVPDSFVEKIRTKYGEDSNMWRVRVLGQFPVRDGDSFIPYDLAFDASQRKIMPQDGHRRVLGIDVARGGADVSVISYREGDKFEKPVIINTNDTMRVVAKARELAEEKKVHNIFVDVIGWGAGVSDRLEELGFPVTAVNVSEVGPMLKPEKYSRLRDELWGNFRDWLETRRGCFWDNEDQDVVGELSSPKYEINSSGKIVIESKDRMKKRGLHSPNIADAMIMTFSEPISEYTKGIDDFWDDMFKEKGQEYQPLDPIAGY